MIEQVTFAEIEADPDFAPLVVEYGAERGLPPPRIRADIYRRLDDGGQMHFFTARAAGRLIGFAFLMVSVNSHGLWLGTMDSIFVSKAHRFGRAGLGLLDAAKSKAKEIGVPRLVVTAPCDTPLARLLPRLGFDRTNELFTMKLSDADPFGPALPAPLWETPRIPAMSDHAIRRVYDLEREAFKRPQVPVPTLQILHGGNYLRTVFLPAGAVLTGALLKIPTTLIISGDALVYVGEDKNLKLSGYNVVPGSAGRKQSIFAVSDLHMTMVFPSTAETAEEAEREFTDEVDLLASQRQPDFNHVVITGE